ncbi:hypothetical protein EGM88_05460 [Aureibaculum marinum]|uniref:Uncharacterized protein n=1 Tax=Aureibaculum marinum TaxID=2487930 RepID=A0A3N4P4G9_9FLAO|nr:hypothetical protein [Aureibaculum marinum]RPD98639.1 hypothetical protein EGM88_05460 [Aureibaculum marinum]
MASVKNLKKDINYVLSDVIEECYQWQILQDDSKNKDKAESIIDEAISIFDELIEKVNTKKVEDKKAHFKAIKEELQTKGQALLDKIEKL